MKVLICDKFKVGEHGEWKTLKETPNQVLLEHSNDLGEPTGFPAIKINNELFHFGNTPSENAKFRVLALETIVVLIQE
jgi:hypothetical protein